MGFLGGFMGITKRFATLLGFALLAQLHPIFASAGGYGTANPIFLPAYRINDYAEVMTGSSPDNSFELITSLIDSGKREIRLGAYMLRSPGIAQALENAAKRGVKVTLLLDGWTVARPKAQKVDVIELFLASKIVKAGGRVYYLKSATGRRDDRRFKYLHAKYAVVDDSLFLSSENFANNGFSPTSSMGSRGWVIAIKNASLARQYADIFDEDIAPTKDFRDIVSYGSHPDYTLKKGVEVPPHDGREGSYRPSAGTLVKGIISLERVMSPDDALAPKRAIIGAIREAKETLEIQSLSFAPHWGKNGSTPKKNPSPIAEEVLAAARRGVKVRIMVNPLYFLHSTNPKENEPGDNEGEPETNGLWKNIASTWEDFSLVHMAAALEPEPNAKVDTKNNSALIVYLRDVAEKEKLDLEANFFFVKDDSLRILHNKGMVVDGRKTLISSINWTENSMKNNREAAVIVDNAHVARYYQNLFDVDWQYHRNSR
jgi:phosphatidylserine/phosphatidylglycerophosphate/cardiolipin synthase-like enzyme